MLNPQQQYNHSEYIKCCKAGDFAKKNDDVFKCKCGKSIGGDKVFRVFRALGIVDKNNIPYSNFVHLFRVADKKCHQGENDFTKPVTLIRPESEELLALKIIDYLEEHCVCRTRKPKKEKSIIEPTFINENKEVKNIGSPLDYNREDALQFIQELPEKLHNSFFAAQLKEKWGFSQNEINN